MRIALRQQAVALNVDLLKIKLRRLGEHVASGVSDHSTEHAPDLEDYDYPGYFTDRERDRLLATRALQRHRADYHVAEGRSDVTWLVSGQFLPLAGHSRVA
ncbi:contractile injection system protein, VgrG/Pvc8 family [Stenotrophomonas rhizophila]|uniref:contractile injection system protein, VgrG/Pvc8 family n=1 Tax=Stenotrophomonas rhizophila TaxID=216778 RepID=UPI00224AD413|nr:contractile injection system protein, VgrG/Pvc8 family [Stenotrophomonas rhizophila]MCX2920044.1 contractile injection system protein, VgrG/Pvc8 family [Stenotrophomonas rhizophila]